MNYGSQNKILCQTKKENGKIYYKTIEYEQFGWKCSMKMDECDIIFVPNDKNKNSKHSQNATNKLKIFTWKTTIIA